MTAIKPLTNIKQHTNKFNGTIRTFRPGMRFPERLGNGVMLKFLRGLVEGVAYVTPPFSTVLSEGDKRVDVSAATATSGDGT